MSTAVKSSATLAELIVIAQRAAAAASNRCKVGDLDRLLRDFATRVGADLYHGLSAAGWHVEVGVDGPAWFPPTPPPCPWNVPAHVALRADAAHLFVPARIELRLEHSGRGGLAVVCSCNGMTHHDWCPLSGLRDGLLRSLGWVYATAGVSPPEIEV